jgi:hypothetical protein
MAYAAATRWLRRAIILARSAVHSAMNRTERKIGHPRFATADF